jgi:hypothetical protein
MIFAMRTARRGLPASVSLFSQFRVAVFAEKPHQ